VDGARRLRAPDEAGSASLAVRALLGKDDKTTFDVTTGTLDSAEVAPGNISKVQFKVFNGDGDVALEQELLGHDARRHAPIHPRSSEYTRVHWRRAHSGHIL
jgi:hypothetical protein